MAAVAAAGAAAPHAASSGKAQLITKADSICRSVDRQTAPYQKKVNKLVSAKHPDYKRMASALNKGVAIEQAGLDRLRALPVPAADRAAVTKVWNELSTIISASQDMSTAVGDGNIPAVNEATQRKAGAQTVYDRLAKAFGFRYCGGE